ncbi:hypothetical protein UIA24_23100, partial [Pseudomonas sp. AL 58]|uniref:hypothetical protein n=1 Tax=Pseudomonas sp. AL 58 TaxID=3104275 RepID=UPI002EAA43A0|nr:hypothetical protein [Pseudomonas sp. AL 58]
MAHLQSSLAPAGSWHDEKPPIAGAIDAPGCAGCSGHAGGVLDRLQVVGGGDDHWSCFALLLIGLA